jgi:hypothetical protein
MDVPSPLRRLLGVGFGLAMAFGGPVAAYPSAAAYTHREYDQ